MIPAAATVLECPDFAGAKPWRRGETTKAGVQHWTIVVETPHCPLNPPAPVVKAAGSLAGRGCEAPLPKVKVRCLATGMLERSGFGISTLGTWLTSGVAGFRTMRNSRNFPTQGSVDCLKAPGRW